MTERSWKIAEQGFASTDFDLAVEPYVHTFCMTVRMGSERVQVFFDPAGRISHIRRSATDVSGGSGVSVDDPPELLCD